MYFDDFGTKSFTFEDLTALTVFGVDDSFELYFVKMNNSYFGDSGIEKLARAASNLTLFNLLCTIYFYCFCDKIIHITLSFYQYCFNDLQAYQMVDEWFDQCFLLYF